MMTTQTEIAQGPLTIGEGTKLIAMLLGAFLFMSGTAFVLAACWAGDTAYHYQPREVRNVP